MAETANSRAKQWDNLMMMIEAPATTDTCFYANSKPYSQVISSIERKKKSARALSQEYYTNELLCKSIFALSLSWKSTHRVQVCYLSSRIYALTRTIMLHTQIHI